MQTIKDLGTYTFPALFSNSINKFSKQKALSFVNGEPITYARLSELTQKVACILYSLGIKKGDKVAIYGTSSPNWAVAYFAIVNYGAIAVPLLPDFNKNEVSAILEHAEVSGVFVTSKMYPRIYDLNFDLIPFAISLDDFSLLRVKFQVYKDCPTNKYGQEIPPYIEISEDDTASIIYTSGTTGRSKGVELTHKNLVFCAIQCQTMHRVNKRDKCLSFLPLSHVYEFTIGLVMQILNGSCVYYLGRPPTVGSLLPAFKKIKPTIVLSVPLIMEKIYKHKVLPTFKKNAIVSKLYNIRLFQIILHRIAGISLNKTFGGRIKFFGIGGAKVDPLVERFMKDAHFNYAIGYGLTETSPLLAGSGPKVTKPGTIGYVMDGVDLAIINKDPTTGIGEVVAKGPNVMKGYYKDPELTAEAFTTAEDEVGEGWFKTGDLGLIDKKNRLSLKGRLKNLILSSSGENIYPEDIEFVLNQHPLVTESLVVEDKDGLLALVQIDEEKANLLNVVEDAIEEVLYKKEQILSEIQFYVNEQVNRISKVGKVTAIKEFEKTASQKIKRYIYNQKKSK